MQTRIDPKFVILAIFVFSCHPALAAPEKVTPNDLPATVTKTLKARFTKMEIVSAEKETEDGRVVYDIELKQKGRKFEADIQDDGSLLEIEKQVVEKDWSKELLAGLKAAQPNPQIVEVMEVFKVRDGHETPDHFEVTVKSADKKLTELLFTLDGKPMKEETTISATEAPTEEKVALDKIPHAVKAAIDAKFPKATIESAEKGEEDGKQIYELSLRQGKHNIDVTLVPNGTILSYEKAITASGGIL